MIDWLFDAAPLIPQGAIFPWRLDLAMAHVIADGLTAVAYFSIALAIYWVIVKRQDIPFGPLPALFVTFILLSGFHHLADVVIPSDEAHGAHAWATTLTAAVSVATAIAFWRLAPTILRLPSRSDLAENNRNLAWALAEKDAALKELRETRAQLELRQRLVDEVIERASNSLAVLGPDGEEIIANAKYARIASIVKDARLIRDDRGDAVDAQSSEIVRGAAETDEPGQSRRSFRIERRDLAVENRRYRLIEVADITAETRAREAREASDRRLWAAISAIGDGFAIFDADERLLLANDAYRTVYSGVDDLIAPGVSYGALHEAVHERDLARFPTEDVAEWIQAQRAERARPGGASSHTRLRDGRWIQWSERPLENGEFVGVYVDVTALKQREEEMRSARDEAAAANARAEYEATHDALTGLPNRRQLNQHLERLEREGRRDGVTMLMIDLDRFKPINDTHGHAAGDAVLKEAAARISVSVRPSDFVARIGGDEFVAVIGAGDGEPAAREVGRRILAAIRAPIAWGAVQLTIGASVGYATAASEETLDRQLANADLALYRAKNEGRNRIAQFTRDLAVGARDRHRLLGAFRAALENGEIAPYFQPQFLARDGSLRGVEALARWRHPERGEILPVAFLPLAEELELAAALDGQILHKALAAFNRWRRAGYDVPRLSVNFSATRLRSPAIVDELEKYGPRDWRFLSIEASESVLADRDDPEIAACLDRLRALGIALELDAFGDGPTSQASLDEIRPDFVKLDPSFAPGLEAQPERRPALAAVIAAARAVGVPVIASGVETAGQARAFAEEGCHALQGFAFAVPMPEERLGRWLAERPAALRAAG